MPEPTVHAQSASTSPNSNAATAVGNPDLRCALPNTASPVATRANQWDALPADVAWLPLTLNANSTSN